MDTKYTFVSYAHKDRRRVEKELKKREQEGRVFWYDKSIESGADWSEEIATKLEGAESVLYFQSDASRKSDNCKRELAYAEKLGIPVVTVNIGGALGTIVAAILMIGALVLLAYIMFAKYVPVVVGFKTADAIEKLDEYGYSGIVRYEYSDDFDLGIISKQSLTEKAFPIVPVFISQSLGPEESLTIAPDTVGSYVSDGIQMLVDAGLMKFTLSAKNLDGNEFGIITYQTAPAGYKISTNSNVGLYVATNEDPITFTYNGLEITIPADERDSVEINLDDNTVTLIEGYKERDLTNAVTFYANKDNDTFVEGQSFDAPVVITGDHLGHVYFFNCTFNDDVIIKTDTQAVIVGIEGTCTVNGNLCIINNVMNTDVETTLPKYWIEADLPVVVEHGSGTCFMFSKDDFTFNGQRCSFNNCEYFMGESGKASTIVPASESENEALMYLVTQRWESGQLLTTQYVSDITIPGR